MEVNRVGTSEASPSYLLADIKREGNEGLLPNQQIAPISAKSQERTQGANIGSTGKNSNNFPKDTNSEEQKKIDELKRTDAKVRAHEMAHLAAGGGLVRGGANFKYVTGPDGKQYAVAGEVKIDMSVPDDPDAAIQKMQQVRRAALAPSDPSPQDRSVAQQASNIESQMRTKVQQEKNNPKKFKLEIYKTFEVQPRQYSDTSKTPQINFISNSAEVAILKQKLDIKT